MVRHATDVLLVLDAQGTVTWASPSAGALFQADPRGWRRERLTGELHDDERHATVTAIVDRLSAKDGRPIRLRARLCDLQTRERHLELVAVDLLADADVAGVVITIRDTTERTAMEAELRRLAFHDTLTGLVNPDLFLERLERATQRARRTGRRAAVLLCYLDDFKNVNDTFGHADGDALLRELAARFTRVVRATDTVARLGGDEFAVVCEDLDATRDAVIAARRLLATTEEPFLLGTAEVRIGLSVGIAVDDGERSSEELLREADLALYEAKAEGKQRWALHRAAMTARTRARLPLATDLERAVADGELDVAYQPIVDLRTDTIVGVEALARWTHPARGLVSPAEFIDLAEGNGLIIRLGELILDRSLAALGDWTARYPGTIDRLGVNVSPRQLLHPRIVDRVAELLARHAVRPDRLVLELTESVVFEDAGRALEAMHELRRLGVRFAVDDFGTGYSSLSYLHRLPVDIVKIDRSLISDITSDTGARDLVKAIIELGGTLRLDTVAEGIETAEQRALLEAMGCGFGQGYLLARPLPAAELERLLAAVVADRRSTATRPAVAT